MIFPRSGNKQSRSCSALTKINAAQVSKSISSSPLRHVPPLPPSQLLFPCQDSPLICSGVRTGMEAPPGAQQSAAGPSNGAGPSAAAGAAGTSEESEDELQMTGEMDLDQVLEVGSGSSV